MTQLYTHQEMTGLFGKSGFKLNGISYPSVFWRTTTSDVISDLGFIEYEPTPPEDPEITDEQKIEIFRQAIQTFVDVTAISRKYDSGNSLATYINSTNPLWAAEASSFIVWRDSVWEYSYLELDKVLSKERPEPSIEEFIEELPKIDWPDIII